MPFGWAPFGWRPFSMLVEMTLAVSVAVPVGAYIRNYTLEVYLSGGDPIYVAFFPFITKPSDVLSNQQFEGRLKVGLGFEQSFMDGEGFSGSSSSYGGLSIEDLDRRFNSIYQTYSIDGRRIVLKFGQLLPPDQPASYDTYVTLLNGIALDWHHDGLELGIDIRDNAYKLEVPACAGIYGGTGGADGTADMANKRKPRALGSFLPVGGAGGNVTPALIDPVNRVYQVNDGSVFSINTVYDGGYALSGPTGNHATYAALVTAAASVTDGHFATCLAQGMFALGAPPDGEVTCDLQGENTGGFAQDTASVCRLLIYLSAPSVDLIDEGTFSALTAAQPATIGIYLGLDDTRSVKQVIDELLRGIGGWSGFRQDGTFEVGRLSEPAVTSVDTFTDVDIVKGTLKRLNLPSGVNPPPKRQRVTYANNYTLQPDARAGVSAARREMLKNPHREAQHSNTVLAAAIVAEHFLAQDPDPIPGFFSGAGSEAIAIAEADRILSLHGSVKRSVYSLVDKSGRGMVRKLGETITLVSDLFDLDAGKNHVIVGRRIDSTEGRTELIVWG